MMNAELFIAHAESGPGARRRGDVSVFVFCLFRLSVDIILVPRRSSRAKTTDIHFCFFFLELKVIPGSFVGVCVCVCVCVCVSWLCAGLGHVNVIIAGVQTRGLAS